ncbi:hypothetical protein ES703_10552 [subsurface metagenome]
MVRIGPIDPIDLIFETLNKLMRKGVFNEKDAREVLKVSLDPSLSEKKKDEIIDSLFKKPGKNAKDKSN